MNALTPNTRKVITSGCYEPRFETNTIDLGTLVIKAKRFHLDAAKGSLKRRALIGVEACEQSCFSSQRNRCDFGIERTAILG